MTTPINKVLFKYMEKASTQEEAGGSREALLAKAKEQTDLTIAEFKREMEEIESMEDPVRGLDLANKLLERMNSYVQSPEWTSYVALIDYSKGERPSGGMGIQVLRARLRDVTGKFEHEKSKKG